MSDLISRMLANQRAAERAGQESKPLSAEELASISYGVRDGSVWSADVEHMQLLIHRQRRLLAHITHLEGEIARLRQDYGTLLHESVLFAMGCDTHPSYRAKRPPRSACSQCKRIREARCFIDGQFQGGGHPMRLSHDEMAGTVEQIIAERRRFSTSPGVGKGVQAIFSTELTALTQLLTEHQQMRETLRRISCHEEGCGHPNEFGDGYSGCSECASMKELAAQALPNTPTEAEEKVQDGNP